MSYARSKKIGQTPTDPNQLSTMAINGLAIQFGDSSDTVGGFTTSARQNPGSAITFGFDSNGWRQLPIIKIPTRGVIPAFSRVLRALLYMKAKNGNSFPSNTVPGGSVRLDLYGIHRTLDTASVDYQNYSTSHPWGAFGGQTSVDLTAAKVASLDITQSLYDQANALANGTDMYQPAVDIRSEVQYCADRNIDTWLLGWLNANWPAGSGARQFGFRFQGGTVAGPYLDILYVPPICLHASQITAGRPIDLGNVLDIISNDPQQQVYMGFIDQGESGDTVKYFVRNTRTDRVARRLVIEATRSFASRPRSELNSDATLPSAKKLRSVDCYNLHQTAGVTDELTPRGRWKLQASSSTLYDVYFDADFTGTYALVTSNKAFASDETITVSSVKKIKIRAAKWGAGAAAAGDKWYFDTVSDTTDPSFPTDSYDMMSLIPATTGDQDVADTAKKRRVRGAPTQQLRASTYTATVSGSSRTIVPLTDTQLAGLAVGDKVVCFSGTTFEEAEVLAVYLSGATLPTGTGQPTGDDADGDAVALTTVLGASYTSDAFFTGGLYVDSLAKSEDITVDVAGAAAGQAVIPISAAVSWANGDNFTVLSLTTGQTQKLVKQSGGGASITAASNLLFALASGDPVVRENTTNFHSFFAQGAVPLTATLGDRLGYLRVYEARANTLANVV
jgi:hypothetical protein